METAENAPIEEAEGNNEEQTAQTPAPEAPAEPERPEWLLEKYKTVEDQAKAYVEAQKLIGKKDQPKAPEKYEFQVPEELEGWDIDTDDPMFGQFQELAKDLDLPQEAFDKIMSMYLTSEKSIIEEFQQQEQQRLEAEREQLGPRAQARINDLRDWGAQHLSQDAFGQMQEIASSAAGIKFLEEMRGIGREKGVPVTEVRGQNQVQISPEDLQKLQFEKDAHGNRRMSTDPQFRKYVEGLARKMYGEAPRQDMVG